MIYAADFILFSDSRRIRIASAIVLAFATIALIGMKETFLPLAAGALVVLLLAGRRRRLPPILIGVLALAILSCAGAIAYVVSKQVPATDYYLKSIGPWAIIKYGIIGLLDGLLRTWWLLVLPVVLFRILGVIPRKTLGHWIADSRVAIGAYGFLVVMYAAQCALYRSSFPQHSRYDFPAMLLVPLTCCILACEISRQARNFVPERTINYAQLTVAGFLFFALVTVYSGRPPALPVAVQNNIEATNLFFPELQRIASAAKQAPGSPVILEAHGPRAYEAVYSLSYYLRSLSADNAVSVRFHPDEKSKGALFDSLQHRLSALEAGTGAFIPLHESLARRSRGCLSVGIDGPPDTTCTGFQVKGR